MKIIVCTQILAGIQPDWIHVFTKILLAVTDKDIEACPWFLCQFEPSFFGFRSLIILC